MNTRSSSTQRHLVQQQLKGDREHSGPLHRWLLLVDGPSWVGHEIKHNEDANLIIIDGTLILCGSTVEYQTLIRLLQDPLECVPFSDLMPSFEYQRDRKALGKRIQKLRRKLPPYLSIGCEIGAGYVLREKSQ
jgi:hypothetical protein